MLNKKGHIATWLLLFGTLVLITSAWFIYLSFDGKLGRNAEGIRGAVFRAAEDSEYAENIVPLIVQRSIENADKNDFTNSLKTKVSERSMGVERVSLIQSNLFEKLRAGEFEIKASNRVGEYEFAMTEVYVEGKSGENKVKRYFDMQFNFTLSG